MVLLKKKYRHIVETTRSFLLSAFVPSEFWGEDVLAAVSLTNTIPSPYSSSLSPLKSYMGTSLIILHLEFLVVLVSFFVLI
jgi:hypothetical protein